MNRDIMSWLGNLLLDLFFTYLIKLFHRADTLHFKLRDKILFLSQNVYKKYYEKSSKIHDTTDLNQKCIKAIVDNLSPKKIIDVGCGNGFLLKSISNKNFQLHASDIKIHSETKKEFKDLKIKFLKLFQFGVFPYFYRI